MKTFATILTVILTILLGIYLVNNSYYVLLRMFSGIFVLIFGYGVYKLLEYFEDDNRR